MSRIEDVVAELCSEACAGRATGSPQAAAARARIVRELESLKIAPAGTSGYLQHVPACGGDNVLARIPGRGPRADRAILVAAHYDHLGFAGPGRAYLGADDNAAAVALLLQTASRLAARADELGREIILAWFDAEEPPYFMSNAMGSQHFVDDPTIPLERIDMMVCMDLMGHALGGPSFPREVQQSIFVLGAERSRNTGALIDELAARAKGVIPRRLASEVIPALSDYYAFEEAGIPFLFLTCGRWKYYHDLGDTPEKLDYAKIAASSLFLEDLVIALSQRRDQRIDYIANGRDDRATLESLGGVARALIPHIPRAKSALGAIEGMQRSIASSGILGPGDRQQVSVLVAVLESLLQG